MRRDDLGHLYVVRPTPGERAVDAVIIFVSLVLIAVCAAVLGLIVWWVWAYVTTDVIQPYQDPEPPTSALLAWLVS